MKTYEGIATLFARLALAAGFLSAVADRFGYWGKPGTIPTESCFGKRP